MRVLVCGDRNWTDRQTILHRLSAITSDEPITIIAGGARGADTLAVYAAQELGYQYKEYFADWSIGRSAGPQRNRRMLVDGQPDLVLAFHLNISQSKGTANMIAQAKKAGIPVELIDKVM